MEKRPVSPEDRKAFLLWFGSNHKLKEPAALNVLRLLLSSTDLLARLRIVEDCSYLRPLVVISSVGQRQPGLLYQTETGSCHDVETILMDLSLTGGPVHLCPHFARRSQARLFLAARETECKPVSEIFSPALVDLETTKLLASLGLAAKRVELLLLIDQALERRDRASFTSLVAVLKKMPREGDLAPAGPIKSG